MKSLHIAILALVIFISQSRAQTTATITIVTNPPQGGIITGGGTNSIGVYHPMQFQASNGWYLSGVGFSGPPDSIVNGQQYLNPAEVFRKVIQIGQINGNFDPTTITDQSSGVYLVTNCVVTGYFTPLSPTFNPEPVSQTALTGSSVTLFVGTTGRQPISYQWFQNNQPLVGQTAPTLVVTNIQPMNAGTYTLTASNAFGGTISQPATVSVVDLEVFANNSLVSTSSITAFSSIDISFASSFPGGDIFYTLDGSTPDFNSLPYGGPFQVWQSSTVKAIAYSSDLTRTVYSQPLQIVIVPIYTIQTSTTGGGGDIALSANGPYTNNSVVTATAVPWLGFTFMGWGGTLPGTDLTNTITVSSNVDLFAIFGTPLSTTVTGNGSLTVFPQYPLYPYGAPVQVTAVPAPGNYFGLWGGDGFGIRNPFYYGVESANPSISCLFAPLPTNDVALTVISRGAGSVDINPTSNRYSIGTIVQVTAAANWGQQFLNWTGDATGTNNPLSVVLDTSKVINANFSHTPSFDFTTSGVPVGFYVSGMSGDVFRVDASTNLVDWVPIGTATNYFNRVLFSDPASTNLPYRMYRAVAQ